MSASTSSSPSSAKAARGGPAAAAAPRRRGRRRLRAELQPVPLHRGGGVQVVRGFDAEQTLVSGKGRRPPDAEKSLGFGKGEETRG